MQHRAGARDSEVGFEVLVAVPGEGGYPVAFLQPQVLHRDGELFGAGDEVRVGVAVKTLVRLAGDDLLCAVELLRPAKHRRQV